MDVERSDRWVPVKGDPIYASAAFAEMYGFCPTTLGVVERGWAPLGAFQTQRSTTQIVVVFVDGAKTHRLYAPAGHFEPLYQRPGFRALGGQRC